MSAPVRYTSADEDSLRWQGFPFREGDIVISTRSKSGTTWAQMICALLIFQRPDPPATLPDLSPWLDHLIEPREHVLDRLERQSHRRFIKTHTPLDGIPLDPRATYIVVARHPLDLAVSLYHQGANIDRERLRRLTGATVPSRPAAPRPSAHDWLLDWIYRDTTVHEQMDSLPGVLHHLTDAWHRRDAENVLLVHYADLQQDLGQEMRRIAGQLGIAVPEHRWPALVEAATFRSMRGRVDELTPNRLGILKDPAAFFRGGRSGDGRALLHGEEYTGYRERVATLAPVDLLTWLHRP